MQSYIPHLLLAIPFCKPPNALQSPHLHFHCHFQSQLVHLHQFLSTYFSHSLNFLIPQNLVVPYLYFFLSSSKYYYVLYLPQLDLLYLIDAADFTAIQFLHLLSYLTRLTNIVYLFQQSNELICF